jgi:membrane-bound lytic murein transglycosylase D
LIPAPAPSAISALAKAEETRTKKGATRPKAASRHVVKKGETLGQIARAHGVSSEDLRRWNNLSRNAGLKPGQSLKVATVPESGTTARVRAEDSVPKQIASPAPAKKHYTVKRGDTLGAIARTHGISLEDLRRWNNLSRNAGLKPGQALRLFDPTS